MRALSFASILALGLCAGCAGPNGLPSSFSQNASCTGRTQASLAPVPCTTASWPPAGMVVTNPDGGGPQVELWGPPSWSGGGAGG
jgi:hypothetical protein